MTIQNQEIKEVKASFGVNAEVADAIDKKAVAPGKVQKNGDQESESILQGSSLPKTKISMINAVMSKLSQMKKEDVEQQLASMDKDELDEARSEPVDIAFERQRGKTENQQEVEHAARYKRFHGVKSKFADGPNGRTVVYSHSDPKNIKDALIKHHGGENVDHIKIKEAYEQMDEFDEAAKWRTRGKGLLKSRSVFDPRHPEFSAQAKYPDETSTYVKSGPDGEKYPVSRAGRDNPDPLATRGAIKSLSKGTAKTNRTLKQAMRDAQMGKITREDIDVSEDIAAAFSGSDLSEEFKAQATQIFETAVVSSVNMKLAEMAEQAEEEYAEEMQNIEEGLTTKIDEYLDYVVEQWMEENRLAVESGLRSEVTENFLSGLRNLFAENWIDIPEEKVEVVEELASEVEHITASLDEEMQKNIELKKQVEKFEREIAFVEVSEGLTEMQIAKFESLAEAVDYEDAESYKENLETIRMSFFENRSQEVMESRFALDEEFIETYETSEKRLEPNMQVYSAAISRSVKK